jgi:uncharacterized protein YciI
MYDYVPDIVDRRPPHRRAHLELIAEGRSDGRIVMAGPLGEPPFGALIVFRSAADAEAFAEHDPYVANQLVTQWRVEPWNLV